MVDDEVVDGEAVVERGDGKVEHKVDGEVDVVVDDMVNNHIHVAVEGFVVGLKDGHSYFR